LGKKILERGGGGWILGHEDLETPKRREGKIGIETLFPEKEEVVGKKTGGRERKYRDKGKESGRQRGRERYVS